jgi:hypothetical protein
VHFSAKLILYELMPRQHWSGTYSAHEPLVPAGRQGYTAAVSH